MCGPAYYRIDIPANFNHKATFTKLITQYQMFVAKHQTQTAKRKHDFNVTRILLRILLYFERLK